MSIGINLIDQAGVLTTADRERLQSFIVDKCLCTTDELARLKKVIVMDEGASNRLGYWSGQYLRVGADTRNVKAVIVLNAHYLLTVERMEKTLAHEFGHHWTLCYLMDRHEMIGWFYEHAPWLYYRIRGLDPTKFVKDYDNGWHYCDKEVLAEDYKYRFTPYTGAHRMEGMIGNPTSEVRDYIWALGKPYWY